MIGSEPPTYNTNDPSEPSAFDNVTPDPMLFDVVTVNAAPEVGFSANVAGTETLMDCPPSPTIVNFAAEGVVEASATTSPVKERAVVAAAERATVPLPDVGRIIVPNTMLVFLVMVAGRMMVTDASPDADWAAAGAALPSAIKAGVKARSVFERVCMFSSLVICKFTGLSRTRAAIS